MKKVRHSPADRKALIALISNHQISLGDIDTSRITDMSGLFRRASRTDFTGIGSWDTSLVENMSAMFAGCESFNEDISSWNTSRVTNMSLMFGGAEAFNQPLAMWDVSRVTDMHGMFRDASSFKRQTVQDLKGTVNFCSLPLPVADDDLLSCSRSGRSDNHAGGTDHGKNQVLPR